MIPGGSGLSCLPAPPLPMLVSIIWLSQLHPRQEEWPEKEGAQPSQGRYPGTALLGFCLHLIGVPHPCLYGSLGNIFLVGQFATSQPHKGPASKELGRGDDGQIPMASATVWASLAGTWGPVSVPPVSCPLLSAECTPSLAPSHSPGLPTNGVVVQVLSKPVQRSHPFQGSASQRKIRPVSSR